MDLDRDPPTELGTTTTTTTVVVVGEEEDLTTSTTTTTATTTTTTATTLPDPTTGTEEEEGTTRCLLERSFPKLLSPRFPSLGLILRRYVRDLSLFLAFLEDGDFDSVSLRAFVFVRFELESHR